MLANGVEDVLLGLLRPKYRLLFALWNQPETGPAFQHSCAFIPQLSFQRFVTEKALKIVEASVVYTIEKDGWNMRMQLAELTISNKSPTQRVIVNEGGLCYWV